MYTLPHLNTYAPMCTHIPLLPQYHWERYIPPNVSQKLRYF